MYSKIFTCYNNKGHEAKKLVMAVLCQLRFKPTYSATETSMNVDVL